MRPRPYRIDELRREVAATPTDPMGRHRCCPFCLAPLDHHHEGRPRRTCTARACVLRWRAVTRDRAAEYAAKRARRASEAHPESTTRSPTT